MGGSWDHVHAVALLALLALRTTRYLALPFVTLEFSWQDHETNSC